MGIFQHTEDSGGRADAGRWGRPAHLQALGRLIPGFLGQAAKAHLGKPQRRIPPPCLPSAPGGCRWSSRRKAQSSCLNRAQTQGAPLGALQMETSSQILPVQQLHCHKATKELEESGMGEKPLKLRGERSLTAGEKLEVERGKFRIQPMVGAHPAGLRDRGHWIQSQQSHSLLSQAGDRPLLGTCCVENLQRGQRFPPLRECSARCAGPGEPSGAHSIHFSH